MTVVVVVVGVGVDGSCDCTAAGAAVSVVVGALKAFFAFQWEHCEDDASGVPLYEEKLLLFRLPEVGVALCFSEVGQ